MLIDNNDHSLYLITNTECRLCNACCMCILPLLNPSSMCTKLNENNIIDAKASNCQNNNHHQFKLSFALCMVNCVYKVSIVPSLVSAKHNTLNSSADKGQVTCTVRANISKRTPRSLQAVKLDRYSFPVHGDVYFIGIHQCQKCTH